MFINNTFLEDILGASLPRRCGLSSLCHHTTCVYPSPVYQPIVLKGTMYKTVEYAPISYSSHPMKLIRDDATCYICAFLISSRFELLKKV